MQQHKSHPKNRFKNQHTACDTHLKQSATSGSAFDSAGVLDFWTFPKILGVSVRRAPECVQTAQTNHITCSQTDWIWRPLIFQRLPQTLGLCIKDQLIDIRQSNGFQKFLHHRHGEMLAFLAMSFQDHLDFHHWHREPSMPKHVQINQSLFACALRLMHADSARVSTEVVRLEMSMRGFV